MCFIIQTCDKTAVKVAAPELALKTPTPLGRVEAVQVPVAQALKITKVTAKSRWLAIWARICMVVIRMWAARLWASISIILKPLRLRQGITRI